MNEDKTVLVTLVESATAKIKVEVRLEDLFRSDQMTAKDRMNFLHNVLGWASTKDLADELRLRGYSIIVDRSAAVQVSKEIQQKFSKNI